MDYNYAVPTVTPGVPSMVDFTENDQRYAEQSYRFDEDPLAQPFAGAGGETESYTDNYSSYPQQPIASGNFEMAIPEYNTLEQYLQENPARGMLTIRILSADRKSPIGGAKVMVTRRIGAKTYRFYDVATDAQGLVNRLSLPTPEVEASFDPNSGKLPYEVYDISVTIGTNKSQIFRNATIFPNTESVQPVYVNSASGTNTRTYDEARYTR
jgi:hypothetical protein